MGNTEVIRNKLAALRSVIGSVPVEIERRTGAFLAKGRRYMVDNKAEATYFPAFYRTYDFRDVSVGGCEYRVISAR